MGMIDEHPEVVTAIKTLREAYDRAMSTDD